MAIYKLKDICLKIGSGATPKGGKEAYCDEGISLIRSQNVLDFTFSYDGLAHINDQQAEKLSNVEVKPQDILLNITGDSVARVCTVDPRALPARVNQHVAIIRPDENRVLSSYILYFLQMIKPYLLQIAAGGATRNALTKSMIENLELEVPDILSQKKIVSVLDDIQGKIRDNNEINDNLSAMIDDIYCHTFLRTKHPNTWRIGKLSEVISQINTGLNPRDNFVLGNGNIKYITVKNLTANGTIDFTNCDTVDVTAQSIIHNRSDISVGDILFASIAPLGRCYLINTEPKDWDINESVFSIRPNYQLISSEYLYSYFMSEYFVTKAQSSSTGSIFKGIRIGTLLDMDIVIPPFDIVEQFTNTTKSLFRLKQQCTDEAQQLIKLRNWLLPLLMNGQATIDD